MDASALGSGRAAEAQRGACACARAYACHVRADGAAPSPTGRTIASEDDLPKHTNPTTSAARAMRHAPLAAPATAAGPPLPSA